MTCGLCKQPIRGDEQLVTDHYKCSAELAQSFRDDIAKVEAQRDALLAALKDAEDYLDDSLSPCESDCDCILHTVRAAIAKADAQ